MAGGRSKRTGGLRQADRGGRPFRRSAALPSSRPDHSARDQIHGGGDPLANGQAARPPASVASTGSRIAIASLGHDRSSHPFTDRPSPRPCRLNGTPPNGEGHRRTSLSASGSATERYRGTATWQSSFDGRTRDRISSLSQRGLKNERRTSTYRPFTGGHILE